MAMKKSEITDKLDELLALFGGDKVLAINALKTLGNHEYKNKNHSDKKIISVLDLDKTYRLGGHAAKVLDGISLDIYEGEFVAIEGVSGSGKSTLLQLIGGLDSPSAGRVIVNDEDISKLSDKRLSIFRNSIIGFVFQFFYLQPFLTLSKNIEIPAMPSRMDANYRRLRTTELLDSVGLRNERNHYPSQLSGGQIQRAAIARALYNHPRIILADEPTGNLDSVNGRIIIDLFMEIRKKFGTTVVIVTHDHKIAKQADRVITLADGKII